MLFRMQVAGVWGCIVRQHREGSISKGNCRWINGPAFAFQNPKRDSIGFKRNTGRFWTLIPEPGQSHASLRDQAAYAVCVRTDPRSVGDPATDGVLKSQRPVGSDISSPFARGNIYLFIGDQWVVIDWLIVDMILVNVGWCGSGNWGIGCLMDEGKGLGETEAIKRFNYLAVWNKTFCFVK